MADKGLRPGFRFPVFPAPFGISCLRFGVVKSSNAFVVPLVDDRPIPRSVFGSAEQGSCTLEVFSRASDPLKAARSEAVFFAEGIVLRWAAAQEAPKIFAVFQSQRAEYLYQSLLRFVGQSIHLRLSPPAFLKIKRPDPWNEGWTLGWGVYRNDPWDFRGIYETEAAAKEALIGLGANYAVAFGSNRDGTDDFITSGFGN